MSLRKDLPPGIVADVDRARMQALAHPAIIRASAQEHTSPGAVLEAVQTVGAQVREHRASIDIRLNEMQANLQNTQQAIAKIDTQGGPGVGAQAVQRVSATVLAEAGDDLADMRTGRRKSIRMSVPSLHPQAATITSGDLEITGQRDSDVYGPMRRATSVRDLLITRRTTAPSIEYLRATRTGAAAIQAAEGDVKAELAMGFTLLQSAVKTIACWVPASRQALDDATMLADYIDYEPARPSGLTVQGRQWGHYTVSGPDGINRREPVEPCEGRATGTSPSLQPSSRRQRRQTERPNGSTSLLAHLHHRQQRQPLSLRHSGDRASHVNRRGPT